MKAALQFSWRTARVLGSGAWSLALWSAWLLLAVLLAVQVWCYRANELAVPDFLLRSFAARLAASDLHASFGRTVFDPTGRILIEDLKLSSPTFSEPLASAHLIYVRLDPWALLTGQFEPEEMQLSGVTLYEPAMLSASGRAEPVIRNLEATVRLHPKEIELREFSAQVGGIGVSATGVIPIPAGKQQRDSPLPVADFLSREYPRLSHEISDRLRQLDILESPEINLRLSPSDARGLMVEVSLLVPGLRLEPPVAGRVRNLVIATSFPATGASAVPVQVEVSADEVRLPGDTVVEMLRAHVRGTLRPDQRAFHADDAEVTATRLTSARLPAPLTRLHATGHPQESPLRATVTTEFAGALFAADLVVDLAGRTAEADLRTRLTDSLLDPLSTLTGRNWHNDFKLGRPVPVAAHVRLDPDWKLASLDGRLDGEDLTARNVHLDELRGRLHYAGTELAATEVVLVKGENLAKGSYTMDTASRDYRFLLSGRLRPIEISPWFGDWWPRLFAHFDFRAAVPAADVDVQGRWGQPDLTTVFIAVDADSPGIAVNGALSPGNGATVDHAHTVLFIRPQYYEARELSIRQHGGRATGTFARSLDPVSREPRALTFQVESAGIDLETGAGLFGETGRNLAAPFRFGTPPDLRVNGRIDFDANSGRAHPTVHVEGSSRGPVEFYSFPLANPVFVADTKDDDITVRPEVDFGGGRGTGQIWLTGSGSARRLRFDYHLKDATVGAAADALEDYSARLRQTPRGEKSAYLAKAAEVTVDASAAAEGPLNDLFGLHGQGQAEFNGAELAEVHLFGGLSQALKVLSLRFTRMQTSFQIDGPDLVLPDVKITGANSAINARGVYYLRTHALDFSAKVLPFSESSNFIKEFLNAATAIFSNAVEVRLSGTPDKPVWSLVPTVFSPNPLRREGNGDTPEPPAASGAAPAAEPSAPSSPPGP